MKDIPRTRTLKVLQISQDVMPHVGGTTHVVYYLCRELSKDPSFDITWCAGGEPHDIGLPNVRLLLFRQYNPLMHMGWIDYPLWGPWSLIRLFLAIRECDVVHVHSHYILGGCAALTFARLLGKPSVITLHSLPWQETLTLGLRSLIQWINQRISRYAIPLSNTLTTMSDTIYEMVDAQLAIRCVKIPNGVDKEKYAPASPDEKATLRIKLHMPSDSPVLLFVGRFVVHKGLGIIHSVAELRPDWNWWLIGAPVGGVPVDPKTWNLPNVHVVGRVDDRSALATYLRCADAIVLPSKPYTEGQPLVINEALACGVGAVLTSHNGFDGEHGLVQVINDTRDTNDLLRTIERALSNRNQNDIRRAVASVKGWDYIAEEYASLYTAFMASKTP